MHIVTNSNEDLSKAKGPVGHRLQHASVRFGMKLVPLTWIKWPVPMDCPTCQIKHPYKTIHLHMEGDGTVIVSQGVYEHLVKAGLEVHGLSRIGAVESPPPLALTQGKSREQINAENRAIRLLGQPGRIAHG